VAAVVDDVEGAEFGDHRIEERGILLAAGAHVAVVRRVVEATMG
jgi:hypothetical protein